MQKAIRFHPGTLKAAKAVILTAQKTADTSKRWSEETRATVELLSPLIPPDETVLDFGSGVGRMIKALGSRRPDLRFVYVDESLEMARLAHKYIGRSVIHRTRFLRYRDRRSLDLSIRPNSIGFIVCIYVLQHVDKRFVKGILESFYRALRPGGSLFLLNMDHRCIPILTREEAQATSGAEHDRALIRVANSGYTAEKAWADDGVDVRGMAHSRFKNETPIAFPAKGFAQNTPREHFIAVYRKGSLWTSSGQP